ncbi:MAG: BTAD domain-containing putative transcriptional regulator [Actinomycetota bacterium]
MQFRVLGPLEIVDDDGPRELGSKKQRLLLASLLIEPGAVRSTDRLIEDLWGEALPGDPLTSLRAYLSNLRKVVEPNRASGSRSTVLVRRGDGYALAVDPELVDSVAFSTEVERARDADHPEDALAVLDLALGRWRGDAFADATDEDFATGAITWLTELRHEAELRRGEALFDLGRCTEAATYLRRLVERAPYDEAGHALLALSLTADGRQAEGLRAIDHARRMLGEELGLEPGPVLLDAERRILHHDLPAPSPSPAQRAAPTPERHAVTTQLPGRTEAVTSLVELLDRSAQGAGAVAIVNGPAGMGKTRLMEEITGPAASRGRTVMWVQADASTTDIGLWPWATGLRDLLDGQDAETRQRWVGADMAPLAAIVPGLGDEHGVPSDDAAHGRHRAFDAVTQLLRRVTSDGERPIVVFEDAHWADRASLELLAHLVKRLRELPLAIITTSRDEGLDDPRIAEIRALDSTVRLPLQPLDPRAVAEVVATELSSVDGELLDRVADEVQRRAGGNPLLVLHLLRDLDAGDPLASLDAGDAPASVADVVARQLHQLGDGADRLLAAAATAQADWGLDVASAASGVDIGTSLDLVEAAIASGLVVEVPDRVGHFRFSHDLVREAIDARSSALRRAHLYATVGREIEARRSLDDPEVVADLARHYCVGAPAGTAIQAAEWSITAADLSLETHDPDGALRVVAAGLDALEHHPRGADADRLTAELLLMRSAALRRLHESVESKQTVLAAWDIAERLDDSRLMARTAVLYSGNHAASTWLGYWVDGTSSNNLTERALARCGDDVDPADHARLLNALAFNRHDGFGGGAGTRITDEALTIARSVDDPQLLIETLAMRHQAAQFTITVAERLGLADEIIATAKGAGMAMNELHGRRMRLGALLDLGDAGAVAEQLNAIEALAERNAPDPIVEFAAAWVPVSLEVAQGHLDGAETAVNDLFRRYGTLGEGRLDVLFLLMFLVCRERRLIDVVEPGLRGRLETQDSAAWKSALAMVLVEADRDEEAAELLGGMPDDDFTTVVESPLQYMTPALAAEAVAHLGDAHRAALLLQLLTPAVGLMVNFNLGMQYHGPAGYFVGRLLRVVDDLDGAEATLVAAREQAAGWQSPLHVARCDLALAEVAIARGASPDVARLIDLGGQRGWAVVAWWGRRLAGG